MIQAVIFDIDGTLVDSVDLHARAWQEALQDFGHEFPYEQVRHEIGKGGDELLPDLLPPKAVKAQGEDIKAHRAELFKRKYLPDVRPFPGVRHCSSASKPTERRSPWHPPQRAMKSKFTKGSPTSRASSTWKHRLTMRRSQSPILIFLTRR